KLLWTIGDAREDRRTADSDRQSRLAKCAHRLDAKVRPRRARLKDACQSGVERGDGHADGELVVLGHGAEQSDISQNERRFGDDAEAEAAMARELLEDGAGGAYTAFDGLIRIGGSPDGDDLGAADAPKVATQEMPDVLLDVDLAFEVDAVAHLHELVGI